MKLQFGDKDAYDEAYPNLEDVSYTWCIRDMFTQIQMKNDKAMVSGAGVNKIILNHLRHMILEQIYTVNLRGKTHHEIIAIIANAGRTAEKWDAATKNLRLT